MSQITRRRIRLPAEATAATDEKMKNVFSQATPELWRGNAVQFEIGLFEDNVLITDLTNIASLTLEVKPLNAGRNGSPLMTKTVSNEDLDQTLAQETWDDKTKQHALITFTGDETNLEVGSDNTETYWLVVAIVTNDDPGHPITVGATTLKVVEDGTGTAGSPQNNEQNYYPIGDSDARYMQKHADGASIAFKNGQHPYIHIAETDKWYPLVGKIVDGVAVPGFGEGESW